MAEEAVGLVTLADKADLGSTWAKVPHRGQGKPESQKQANRVRAKLRGPESGHDLAVAGIAGCWRAGLQFAGDPHYRDPGRTADHYRRRPAPHRLRQTLDAINHGN